MHRQPLTQHCQLPQVLRHATKAITHFRTCTSPVPKDYCRAHASFTHCMDCRYVPQALCYVVRGSGVLPCENRDWPSSGACAADWADSIPSPLLDFRLSWRDILPPKLKSLTQSLRIQCACMQDRMLSHTDPGCTALQLRNKPSHLIAAKHQASAASGPVFLHCKLTAPAPNRTTKASMGAEPLALEEAYIGTLCSRQQWKCVNACIRRSNRGARRRLRRGCGRYNAANALICSTQGSKPPASPDVFSDFHSSMSR